MKLTMRVPVCWTMLWLALFVLPGCSRSAPEERSGATDTPPQEQRAEADPAPQPAPPPAPASAPEVGTVGSSETPKTAPTQSVPPKPAAPASKSAPVDDVVILKGAPIGGVRLEHKLHAERAGNDCTVCHHPSKPQKPAKELNQACSDCHTKAAAAPMKTRYQAAFHNPTAQSGTCVDCHKAENAKGKKAPLKCQECHKKTNV